MRGWTEPLDAPAAGAGADGRTFVDNPLRGATAPEEPAPEPVPGVGTVTTDVKMHRWTNVFSVRSVEQQYQERNITVYLPRVKKVAGLVFVFVFIYFSLSVDRVVDGHPDVRAVYRVSYIERYVACALSLFLVALLFKPVCQPYWQGMLTVSIAAPGLSVMFMNGYKAAKFRDFLGDDLARVLLNGDCPALGEATAWDDSVMHDVWTAGTGSRSVVELAAANVDALADLNVLLLNLTMPILLVVGGHKLRLDLATCCWLGLVAAVTNVAVTLAVVERVDPTVEVLTMIAFMLSLLLVLRAADRVARHNFLLVLDTSKQNIVMRSEISRLSEKRPRGDEVDLNSPVETILRTLQRVRNSPGLSGASREAMNRAIFVLSTSENLSQPDVWKQIRAGGTGIDKDVGRWLLDFSRDRASDAARPASAAAAEQLQAQHAQRRATFVLQPPSALLPDDALQRTDNLSSWNLDVIALAEATGGRPLLFVMSAALQRHRLIEHHGLDPAKVVAFVTAVETGYLDMPYHNRVHGAEVCSATHFILQEVGFQPVDNDPLLFFAALVAAAVHDFKHPGRSNRFLVETKAPLAILYSDTSVLERFHLAEAFKLAAQEPTNIFAGLSDDDYGKARACIIDMVLATDLSQHFGIVGHLKAMLAGEEAPLRSEELVRRLAIKCADIGHSSKARALHMKWTERAVEEFFQQGDHERELGMPISPFMDRSTPDTPKNQTGFFDFIVTPLFEAVGQAAQESHPAFGALVQAVHENHDYWAGLVKSSSS